MDLTTVAGIFIGIAAILVGQALEGGHIGSITQPTAALIVLGGTFGAVVLQFPAAVLKQTVRALKQAFVPEPIEIRETITTLVLLANKARRNGLIAIENDVAELPNAFMRRGLELVIDGTDARVTRNSLEFELNHHEDEVEQPPKVLEAAGGYAPTVGILGAVLGLIHVMENLSDPTKLGGGIAVAFVATVYGVGSANLLFLPLAGKLKARAREKIALMAVMIEGICAIAEGENPRLIERKLGAFLDGQAPLTREAVVEIAKAV